MACIEGRWYVFQFPKTQGMARNAGISSTSANARVGEMPGDEEEAMKERGNAASVCPSAVDIKSDISPRVRPVAKASAPFDVPIPQTKRIISASF